ncbi:MAG: glutaminyl-peptide cyclotransferase [Crocinitomicaceae bacterium]|nr:glutaminyl-peptide cyclotransferase [Crocinitomicaceae bacterium]
MMRKSFLLIFVFFAFFSCDSDEKIEEESPVSFSFNNNIVLKKNQKKEIKILVKSTKIKTLELLYNDKLLNKWDSPSKTINYIIESDQMALGTRYFSLRATMQSGEIYDDKRAITIYNSFPPILKKLKVIEEYPHNDSNYTQGLEFYKDELYESTGDPGSQGKSMVAKINLLTGETLDKAMLGRPYFGEGITALNDTIYQLTWKSQECKMYDANALSLLKTLTYSGEGWGICNNGKEIITSDGTHKLFFRNPQTFAIIKTIEVHTDKSPIGYLNELEYINGEIYANVYMQDVIVVIDPLTGGVKKVLDASQIVEKGKGNGEVLNGIAFNKKTQKLYVTGKFWAKTFEVKIN